MRKTAFLRRIACVSILAVALAGRSETTSDNSYLGSIPFELVLKHIVVNTNVNNSGPSPFILDTGDQFAVIDIDRAKQLGLTLQGDIQSGGAGAEVLHGSYVRGSSFAIPGLSGVSQPLTLAFPLKSLEAPLGHKVDGVIGGDFIKEFVVELDYQSHVVRLYDKGTFRYSGHGQNIPIEMNADGHPVVEAEVTPEGGRPLKGKFLVDIGSSASLALYSPFVAAHDLPGPNLKTIRAIGAAGAGGQLQAQIGRVAELKIGEFTLAQPITLFSQDKAGAFARSDTQGNLGEQVLSRFRLFLDYSHGRIIFEPNKDFGQPFAPAFAGAVLEGAGDNYKIFRVTDVLENSPASEAGLQKGDVITAVDGRPASALSLSEIAEMFERSTSYSLDIQRDDTRLRVTLRPPEIDLSR
jgi:PDZ domain/Aspartyl protease